MKKILLILLSLNCLALYVPKSKVGMEQKGDFYITKSIKRCESKNGESCAEIIGRYNYKTFSMVDEKINDLEKPVWGTRSLIEACTGEEACKARALTLECQDGREAFYNAEYSEVWCNKITGYEQMLTGRKIVVEDADKKAEYDAKKLRVDNRKKKINRGNIKRKKCLDALAFIADDNDEKELSEEEVDAMEVAFKPIHDALKTCRIKKAIRFIGEVNDVNLTTLKDELLEILK